MSYITGGTAPAMLTIGTAPTTLAIRGNADGSVCFHTKNYNSSKFWTCTKCGVSGYDVFAATGVIVKEGERMRYLYKAWVIKADDVFEVPAFIAKDEVGAKVKAILHAKAEPDEVHVIVQLVGIVPAPDKDSQ